jgi:truncated hemoglobin YjbI
MILRLTLKSHFAKQSIKFKQKLYYLISYIARYTGQYMHIPATKHTNIANIKQSKQKIMQKY